MTTANDLDAIRRLADAATDGPWEHGGNDGLVWPPRIGDPVSGSTETDDAEFIAAARTHVPALCDEVEQLRAGLRDVLDELKDRTAELARARQERDEYAHDNTRVAGSLIAANQTATFRQGVIDRHRAELGAAGEVLAVVRDAHEQIERALATYDTQPTEVAR